MVETRGPPASSSSTLPVSRLLEEASEATPEAPSSSSAPSAPPPEPPISQSSGEGFITLQVDPYQCTQWQSQLSAPQSIHGLTWCLKLVASEAPAPAPGLEAYLICEQLENRRPDWECQCDFTIRLLSTNTFGTKVLKLSAVYDASHSSSGGHLIDRNRLLVSDNGYQTNGFITVMAKFTFNYRRFACFDVPISPDSVVLLFGNERFYADRGVLARQSRAFATLFASRPPEEKEVQMLNVDCYQFVDFLRVLSADPNGKITVNNTESLLELAETYQAPSVTIKCMEFLLEGASAEMSYGRKLLLAEKYNLTLLRNRCIENMADVNAMARGVKREEYRALSAHAKAAMLDTIMDDVYDRRRVYCSCRLM